MFIVIHKIMMFFFTFTLESLAELSDRRSTVGYPSGSERHRQQPQTTKHNAADTTPPTAETQQYLDSTTHALPHQADKAGRL